jgi:hypothetical protein
MAALFFFTAKSRRFLACDLISTCIIAHTFYFNNACCFGELIGTDRYPGVRCVCYER